MKFLSLLLLASILLSCSIQRKAVLEDGTVVRVRYKWGKDGPVCVDSTGACVRPEWIVNISR
jgi:hypothetical protein